MVNRIELFKRMTGVEIHHKTIDEAIDILKELKRECKSVEAWTKYYNTRLLLGLDGEDRLCLELHGCRMENDKEFEARKEESELYQRKRAEELLEKDKEDYARLAEKYPDGIPK